MPLIFQPEQAERCRVLAGLSRDELARRAGITRQALRSIETGDAVPRPPTVKALADALGVEVAELYVEGAVA